MNYEVLVNNKVWKRHVDQILKSTELTSKETNEQTEEDDSLEIPSFTDTEHNTSPETVTSSACYPSRDRRPPDRLSYN